MANSFSLTGALSGAYNTAKNAISNYVAPKSSGVLNMPTSNLNPSYGSSQAAQAVPAPSTPVKKVTQPNGVTTEYHAPAKETPQKSASSSSSNQQAVPTYGSTVTDSAGRSGVAMFDPNTGKPLTNPNVQTGTTSGMINQNPQPAPTPSYTPENTTYGGLISEAANRSQSAGQDYLAAQAEAKRISDQQTALAQDFAQKNQNIAGTAGFLTQETGLQGQLANKYNTVQGALANQYNAATNRLGAANTQQGLQQGLLTSAIGASAPVQISPTNTLVSPVNNQAQYGIGTANNAGGGASTGANNLIAATALQNNANQATNYANQSAAINLGMQNLRQVGTQADQLLASSGINWNESTKANATLNSLITQQSNPAAFASLQAVNADIQKYLSQIVSANTGLTPTEVSGQLSGLDITNMTRGQLQNFLANVDSLAMGQLSNVQQAQQGAQGAGTNFYSGAPANATQTGMNGGTNNYWAAAGSGLIGAGSGIAGAAGGYSALTNLVSRLPAASPAVKGFITNFFK